MLDTAQLRDKLFQVSPELCKQLKIKIDHWATPILNSLDQKTSGYGFPKTFNDPIWGVITLYPWETLILDSPLLQRLRGVRQLGMAHHVYPSASHDRLEHSRGVVEASERMMKALTRNAEFRRKFGIDRDEEIPNPSDLDYVSTRLAALMHDIGHSSFSHATEDLVEQRLSIEFSKAKNILRERFEGVTNISASEVVAVLFILSESMQKILEHPKLEATDKPSLLPLSIVARILGSRSFLDAGYLSGVISGPIDADKLDYMARDCHHAGLPLGLDLERLISKLEVVTITPENAPNPELKQRASVSKRGRVYEIGISLSGLGAYEQMIIGRVILYDRLYYHHKVRSAEAMVRRLIMLAEETRGREFALSELFYDAPDDTTLGILGGEIQMPGLECQNSNCSDLSSAIQNRQVYYRAFAFAPRFIGGLSTLPEKEQRDAKAILWQPVLSELSTIEGCNEISKRIYEIASELKNRISALAVEDNLQPEHILVDLPINRVIVRGGDILTRAEDGQIATPNLFFDPERWSQAYEHQKQCGFVFTQRQFVRLVAVASRIAFFEMYRLVMDGNADRASKTSGKLRSEWFSEAAKHGICTNDCAEAFSNEIPSLIPIHRSDIDNVLPETWRTDFPKLSQNLAENFQDIIPSGLTPSVHKVLLEAISHLVNFQDTMEKGGDFVNIPELPERTFQNCLRNHLRAREADVQEGTKLGGGETDLILSGLLVIENKVVNEVDDPFLRGKKFGWQARRYSIPISKKIAIVAIAYKPKNETLILDLDKRFKVVSIGEAPSGFAEVRCVIPWGHSVPSKAKLS